MWAENPKSYEYVEMFDCRLGYWAFNKGGFPTYFAKTGSFDMSFLPDEEINDLIEKSLADGVNYLFEKVKDHKIILNLKPDCIYA